MRYNPVLHKKSRASRRGIAVMFALGILSLVIIAVLIFSHRAVIDRKVASAYSRYSGSKDLALSAFGRALLQLKKNAATEDYFYSSGTEDYDWLWKLDPNEKFLKQREIDRFRISWQYVKDSDGHIIGRYAYIVFGSNQLNLNAIMDHSFCPADSKCNGGTKIECPRAQRLGNTATELQFDPSRFTGWFSATFDKDKVQDIKGQYEGPEYLFMGASPKLSPASGVSVADAINRLSTWFTVSRSSALKEPDAWFGGDTNGNGVKDKNEYYQRFLLNKTKAQWDTIAASPTTAVNEIMKAATTFYSDDSPKPVNSAGIPWLNNWADTEGNWSSSTTKGKQIAANLINYCASEDRPVVSNITPENWYNGSGYTAPEYTGNKRTWYLNECGVTLEVEVDLGSSQEHNKDGDGKSFSPSWYSFGDSEGIKLKVRLYIEPEIINMFGETPTVCMNCGTNMGTAAKCPTCNSPKNVLPGPANKYRIVGFANVKFDYTHGMSYSEKSNKTDFDNIAGSYSEYVNSYKCLGSGLGDSSIKCRSTGIRTSTSGDVEIYEKFLFKTEKSGSTFDYIEATIELKDSKFASKNAVPTNEEIGAYFKIKGISVSDLALFLKTEVFTDDKLRYVDCSVLPTVSEAAEQNLPATASTTPALKKSFAVDDPRHNLHPEDWFVCNSDTLNACNNGMSGKDHNENDHTWVSPSGGSFANSTAGWDKDPETATDPANKSISTAYIRHAPMQSLWELGAIHRAAPWQTINLKKPGSCSDTLTTNLTTAGGGAYGKGDFRILDQVTMQGGTSYTPEAAFGKVNLYKPSKFTFDSLFRGMPWQASGKYSDLTETTSTITDSGTLAEKLALTASIPLYRRTDIYQTPSGAAFWDLMSKSPVDGSSALTTDAQQEQLVGRFIGLTTADAAPGDATVIVLAQSIQDLGGGAVVYREGWDKVLAGYAYNRAGDAADVTPSAHSKLGDSAYSSSIPSAAYGTYDNGADRITGETKLVGRLLYDRKTKKWKIVQVKYED